MGDEEKYEYSEPNNRQLANFLTVYAKQIPEMDQLQLNAGTLEKLLARNPRFREGALKHHRGFQERIFELDKKMQAGQLRCEYVRKSGKQCPNYNEPGSPFCGLHKEEVADGAGD